MEDLETIKNRIEGNNISKKNYLYKLMMTLLIISSLGLGFLIYARMDPEASLLNRTLGTNLNFSSLNNKISKFMDKMFDFNVLKNNDDEQFVSGEVLYLSLGDDLYCTNSNQVTMLKNGIISHIESDADSYFIVISYEDNITASYFGIYNPIIKKGDQLNKTNIIGEYIDSFKVIFFRNNQKINYEEVIA